MAPNIRQSAILDLLRQRGYVPVDELSRTLGVSRMTVRRDLDQLLQMNLVNRHHGGASLAPEHGDLEWPWLLRANIRTAEKQAIGRLAATYVHDGDVVILDGGSTVLEVAKNLHQGRLAVISYCLPALCLLSSRRNVHLIGIGGSLVWDNQSFVGPWALNLLREVNANVTILGTTCLSLARGMTNLSVEEAELKRAAIEAAEKVILVMDSSKMGRHTLATVGPVEMIDILITDSGLSEGDREALTARGVQVVIADERERPALAAASVEEG